MKRTKLVRDIMLVLLGAAALVLGAREQARKLEGAPTRATEMPAALPATAPEPHAAARPAPPSEEPTVFLELVHRHHYEEKYRSLREAFPDTDTGRAAARAVTLLPYSLDEGQVVEVRGMAGELGYLRGHAADALRDIETAFEHFPARCEPERQFLTQFAARLDVDPARKVEFLAEELSRSSGDSIFSAAIALDALLEVTGDPETVSSAIDRALASNTDARMRALLLSRYERRR